MSNERFCEARWYDRPELDCLCYTEAGYYEPGTQIEPTKTLPSTPINRCG